MAEKPFFSGKHSLTNPVLFLLFIIPKNEQNSGHLTLSFLSFLNGLQPSRESYVSNPYSGFLRVIGNVFLTKCQRYPHIDIYSSLGWSFQPSSTKIIGDFSSSHSNMGDIAQLHIFYYTPESSKVDLLTITYSVHHS